MVFLKEFSKMLTTKKHEKLFYPVGRVKILGMIDTYNAEICYFNITLICFIGLLLLRNDVKDVIVCN